MILAPLGRKSSLHQRSSTHRLVDRPVLNPFKVIFGKSGPLFPLTATFLFTERTQRLPHGRIPSALRDGASGGTARCAASTPPPSPAAIEPFHPGMRILVTTPPYLRSSKLHPKWMGPFYSCPHSKCLPGLLCPQTWGPHSSWCGCKALHRASRSPRLLFFDIRPSRWGLVRTSSTALSLL
ncbi:hypothetical protein GWK47_047077 [Chionoecetes opilio]|uniref:Uncharacterized protein n=1 Tax=Chionoecetes opilio TaxID=41210 RepID=A0A8J4Y503_CHIOP|nr:hypothetical protein GWK47_047077 [Chionoecetes opilio]